jgi:CubicO group peptidase (beta-lactamase class C family)
MEATMLLSGKYFMKFIFMVFFLSFIFTLPAYSEQLSVVKPENVGLSSERLAKIDKMMQKHVDEKLIPGAVILVARHGKIAHLSAVGMMDVESGKPMKTDSIFRLHSMTKPLTSVALLMLYEEGLFQLDDPAEMYIPVFKDLKVFNGVDDKGVMRLSDQKRKMTIHDLFRHTSGLSYGDTGTLLDSDYKKEGIKSGIILKDMVTSLGKVPLYYQPGTRWVYSYAHDVQAYLVEHFSGMTFDKYLQTRLLDPLGMQDTSFNIKNDNIDRLVTRYAPEKSEEAILAMGMPVPGIKPFDNPPNSDVINKINNPAGGTGLLCTAEDYFRFSQMLLNGGRYNGKRILSPKTVELMRQNHIEPGTDTGRGPLGGGSGYGLGVGIVLNNAANANLGSPGQFGWGGYATTYVIIDPEEDMISILLSQRAPAIFPLWNQFQTLAYQAIID